MDVRDHFPVLLKESVDALVNEPNGVYVDGTFGRGGHTRYLLRSLAEQARVIGFDKDPEAIAEAKRLEKEDARFHIVHASFAEMKEVLARLGVAQVNGVLMDLGVSSPQLDVAERGFSFMRDGPLDMRMDTTSGMNAETWVNETAEADMVQAFKEYGEERFAKRIARAICALRETQPFTGTKQLAEVVAEAHPRWERDKHPATRVFQAIRIAVNRELEDLESALAQAVDMLAGGGRIAVISFHSLEDRIVKRFFRNATRNKFDLEGIPKEIPLQHVEQYGPLKLLGKAVRASQDEVEANIRSRSAVLRVAEKRLGRG